MTISEFYAWVDRLAKHQSYAPLWNQQPIWEEWDYERVREPNTLRAIPLDFSKVWEEFDAEMQAEDELAVRTDGVLKGDLASRSATDCKSCEG